MKLKSRSAAILAPVLAAGFATTELATGAEVVLTKDSDSKLGFNLALEGEALRADDGSLEVGLSLTDLEAFAEQLSSRRLIRTGAEVSIYAEGFENPYLVVTYSTDSEGSYQTLDFDLATAPGSIQLPRDLKFIQFQLSAEQQTFKCLSETVCIEGEEERTLFRFQSHPSVKVERFDPVVICGEDLLVEQQITEPGSYKVVFGNTDIRQYLTLNRNEHFGLGAKTDLDHPFVGLGSGTPSSQYPNNFSPRSTEKAYKQLHVFPEAGGIKVVVEKKPNYICNYQRVVSYPESASLKIPVGESCPSLFESRWYFSSATAGDESTYSKDWFFNSCQINSASLQ